MKLSKEQISQFFEDGFLVVDDVFTSDEMQKLRASVDEQMKKPFTHGQHDWPLHRLDAAGSNPTFLDLSKNKKIVDIIKPLLGENIQLQHSKFAIKMPGENKGIVNWHQDYAFFPHSNDSLLAVAVAISDITPKNGGMKMVKGSHKLGLLNHIDPKTGMFAEQCLEPQAWADTSKIVDISPKKGGISIHHCLMVHCAGDNYDKEPRYMVVFEYRASDAYQLADGIWQDTGYPICGKPMDNVRFGGKFLKKSEDGSFAVRLPKGERYGKEYPFGHAYNQYGLIAKKHALSPFNSSSDLQEEKPMILSRM